MPESGQNISKCELKVDHQAVTTFKKQPTTGQSASEKLLELLRQRHVTLLRKHLYDNNPFSMCNRKDSKCVTQESFIP